MMKVQPLQILLVEDNPADARVIREALAKEIDTPFELTHADRLSAALHHLRQHSPNVVLLDLQLPDTEGLKAVVKLHEAAPQVPIVVLTASDDDGLAVQSLQQGAQDYLVKGYVQVYRNFLRRAIRYAIERKRAEEEVRKAHGQHEQLLSSITSLLIGVSPSGFITHWNAVAEAMFGLSVAEMLDRPLADPRIAWEMARILKGIAECRANNAPVRVDDVAFTHRAGHRGLLGMTITPVRGEHNALAGFLLFGADITDRKLAEEALRESEARYRSVIAAMAEGIVLQDAEGRIQACNTSAEHIFGLSADQLQGRTPLDPRWQAIHEDGSPFPGEAHPAMITLQTGKPCSGIVMGVHRPDGTLVWISINSQPLFRAGASKPYAVVASFSEITDRKKAEEERLQLQSQLVQAQKMETIGRFAGGIAHDFENFLQVILGFAWLIRSRHRDDPELINDLQEIVHAAESASGMVRQLLAFSRRQALKPTVLEVSRTIEHMDKMLEQMVGEAITLKLELSSDSLLAKLDPTAFEQMVMNLCSNARDSMRQGGTLTIRTDWVPSDAAFRDAHPGATAADYVRVSIADTGMGMDPKVAANIFEPFFTTKRSGQGTGLGLAVVYGLVKQHDGFIDVETAPERGTVFHVYFPRQELAAGHRPQTVGTVNGPSARSVTVLVIESEARQRELVETVLREAGYEVTTSSDGGSVAEWVACCPRPPQLVILDGAVIEGEASVLLQQMREACPGVKVLVVSGRRDEQLQALSNTLPGVHVLRKPYVPAQLLDGVRMLFEHEQSSNIPAVPRSSSTSSNLWRILVVDDDVSILKLCRRLLGGGYHVTTVSSGREALAVLKQHAYHLLVTDIKMPDMDGFELIAEAVKCHPALPILAMSGLLTTEMEERLRTSARRCDVLRKPFTATAFEEAVKRCL